MRRGIIIELIVMAVALIMVIKIFGQITSPEPLIESEQHVINWDQGPGLLNKANKDLCEVRGHVWQIYMGVVNSIICYDKLIDTEDYTYIERCSSDYTDLMCMRCDTILRKYEPIVRDTIWRKKDTEK